MRVPEGTSATVSVKYGKPYQEEQNWNGEGSYTVGSQGAVGREPGKHQEFKDGLQFFGPEQACHSNYKADLYCHSQTKGPHTHSDAQKYRRSTLVEVSPALMAEVKWKTPREVPLVPCAYVRNEHCSKHAGSGSTKKNTSLHSPMYRKIVETIGCATFLTQEKSNMAARKVILYFDDQGDALRFALAAGSIMSGETLARTTDELIQETQRATRVKLGDSVSTIASPAKFETSAAT
jgi:hypothetical protein